MVRSDGSAKQINESLALKLYEVVGLNKNVPYIFMGAYSKPDDNPKVAAHFVSSLAAFTLADPYAFSMRIRK